MNATNFVLTDGSEGVSCSGPFSPVQKTLFGPRSTIDRSLSIET
jgi:hypothetical protein